MQEVAAEAAHEANRVIQSANAEEVSPPWADAPEWQRQSSLAGVQALVDNPLLNPIDLHDSWSRQKVADGWVYGPVKDAEAKTHPCLVAYHELPEDQRLKDRLFGAVVRAVLGL